MQLWGGGHPLERARQTSYKLLILQWFYPEASGDGVVRPEGLEPPTLGSEVRCSIQLSYGRTFPFQTLRKRPCQGRGDGTGSF
jgi:hypothetical protein